MNKSKAVTLLGCLVENKEKDNTFFKKIYQIECNIGCNINLLDKFSVIGHVHYLPQLKPKGLNVLDDLENTEYNSTVHLFISDQTLRYKKMFTTDYNVLQLNNKLRRCSHTRHGKGQ